jgi:hypothetical protein
MTLRVERKDQPNETPVIGGFAMMTPALGNYYWSYRVLLSERQAVVAFPKFTTIGIGFAVEEEDWNTNLPWTCPPREIFDHIIHNKGDDAIADLDVLEAIAMIQFAIAADGGDAERKSR